MFTGIVQAKRVVRSTSISTFIKKVSIEKPDDFVLSVGESVNIDGICSTVVEVGDVSFSVEYMKETLKVTTAENFVADLSVNLEKSLRVGDSLSGHFVYGHVDCLGVIHKIKEEGGSKVFSISIPKEFHKSIAYKGSVTVDGVSLTISEKTKEGFAVSLIPFTLNETNLGEKKVSDMVNIETDILSKYLENLSKTK